MKTRMTELLGIKYPIMQGGMQHLGVPELAAAVSEAGGLGTINVTIYPDPEDLRKAIKEVKAKTDKPFAVNISLIPSLHPGQELFDQVKVILEEGVTAVETAGASPQELADVLNAHKDQVKWIHKAACVKHAKKAESMGADLITMAGFEVAGHPHTDGVGTMVLANRTATCPNGGKSILVRPAMRSDRMGIPTWKRGPMLGEHTEEVLKEIGYTDEQIKAMEEKKAAVQIDTTQFKHLDEEM